MNINFLQQLMKSGNPYQMIMNMMTPQQKQLAQQFLNDPNREQALEKLKKDYNVSNEQVESLTKMMK